MKRIAGAKKERDEAKEEARISWLAAIAMGDEKAKDCPSQRQRVTWLGSWIL